MQSETGIGAMGSFLDKPVTEKHTAEAHGKLCGESLAYGVSDMQGWRIDMEDAHICELALADHPELAFFGVFDGHGGSFVSTQSAKRLLGTIAATEGWKAAMAAPESASFNPDVQRGLRSGFLTLDRELRQSAVVQSEEDHSGSTAVSALISKGSIFIANLGDSRAIVVRGGQVVFGTEDHKPYSVRASPRRGAPVSPVNRILVLDRCGEPCVLTPPLPSPPILA